MFYNNYTELFKKFNALEYFLYASVNTSYIYAFYVWFSWFLNYIAIKI